jgi:hypothetical protein
LQQEGIVIEQRPHFRREFVLLWVSSSGTPELRLIVSMNSSLARRLLYHQPEAVLCASRLRSAALFLRFDGDGLNGPTRRRRYATVSSRKPKIVDLSRELYHRALAHPAHPPVIITQWDTHQPMTAGNTVLRSASYSISFSDHSGTHVDAPKHFDATPGALSVDQMPLETFYTEGFALDLSHVELGAAIGVPEMEEALKQSGEEIKEGDTGTFQLVVWLPEGLDTDMAKSCSTWPSTNASIMTTHDGR